jgi:hypothetical protein
MNWLTVKKHPFLYGNGSFSFYVDLFFPRRQDLIGGNNGCLIRNRNCLSFYCGGPCSWSFIVVVHLPDLLLWWSMFLIFYCGGPCSWSFIVVVHVPDLFLVFCVVNFSWLSSFCVLCCLCLWIVHSRLPLRFSVLCFVCLRFVSCVQCSMCLWIVHSWLSFRFSLTFIYRSSFYPFRSSVIKCNCVFYF